MVTIIDLREKTEYNQELYENIFVPMANVILQRSLYLDRTDPGLLQRVFSQSHTFMGDLMQQLLKGIKSLKNLSEKDRHTIFFYWFNIQVKSRIFILDPEKKEYLAYNGKISSDSFFSANQNFRFSHGFIRINQDFLKDLREVDRVSIIYKDNLEVIDIK
jgi:hypothetical protein